MPPPPPKAVPVGRPLCCSKTCGCVWMARAATQEAPPHFPHSARGGTGRDFLRPQRVSLGTLRDRATAAADQPRLSCNEATDWPEGQDIFGAITSEVRSTETRAPLAPKCFGGEMLPVWPCAFGFSRGGEMPTAKCPVGAMFPRHQPVPPPPPSPPHAARSLYPSPVSTETNGDPIGDEQQQYCTSKASGVHSPGGAPPQPPPGGR